MQSIKSIADLLKFGFRRIPAPVEFEEQPPIPSEIFLCPCIFIFGFFSENLRCAFLLSSAQPGKMTKERNQPDS
jgi:hypothetical protein